MADRESSSVSGANDSIFTQILDRLFSGTGVKLDDDGSLEGLEILLENSGEAVLLISEGGAIVEANPTFCQTYGWSREELEGQGLGALISQDQTETIAAHFARIAVGNPAATSHFATEYLSFHVRTKRGPEVTVECMMAPLRIGSEGRVVAAFYADSVDRGLIRQLKQSNEHYLALSETIPEAIFRLDSDFTIIFANSGVKNTFGFDRDELIMRKFSMLFPEEVFLRHREEFRKYFIVDDRDRLAHGLKQTIEILGTTKNRGVAPMEMSFGNSRDLSGRTLTCIIRDISQRKTMERRLRHLAFHDKLTGLGNRDLFAEDSHAFMQESPEGAPRKAGIIFLDLDGFKHVNDALGHSAGDQLLVETARRIRVCLREADSAYRFSGDEFVAFLPGMAEPRRAAFIAERVLSSIRLPFEVKTYQGSQARVEIGVSIGVALLPDHGEDLDTILHSAEIAMYCSKEAGKNRVTVYDESLDTKSNESWRVEQAIRSGLVNGEFQLHYQPIVAPSGRLLGLEALIRWQRDGVPYMEPGSFIPIAERNGMIIPLGSWVFRRAFADLRRLERAGYGRLYCSLNVSGKQFEQPDFVRTLCDAIEQAGADSSRLNLELTETTLMNSSDEAVAKILEIKRRYPEIMLSIDDFGTGYSSLSYLSRLPVDVLKIDISFVRALRDEQNRKVVNSILSLAESLGINVVAEGIETTEQRLYFRDRNCYGLQGFLFMQALPIDELERRFAAIKASHRRG